MKIKTVGKLGLVTAVVGWIALLIVLATSGCSLFGANPAPPSALESRFYDFTTNVVQKVVTVTNQVAVTNYAVETVRVTNVDNVVVEHPVTNYQTVLLPQVTQVTNGVMEVSWKPNTNAAAVQSTIGDLAGLTGIPGAKALGGLLAGGIFGIWGMLRGSKGMKTAGVLTQVVEVGRNLMQQTPQGAQAEQAWRQWMVQHQAEQGVIQNVLKILPSATGARSAEVVAADLQRVMDEVQAGQERVRADGPVAAPAIRA